MESRFQSSSQSYDDSPCSSKQLYQTSLALNSRAISERAHTNNRPRCERNQHWTNISEKRITWFNQPDQQIMQEEQGERINCQNQIFRPEHKATIERRQLLFSRQLRHIPQTISTNLLQHIIFSQHQPYRLIQICRILRIVGSRAQIKRTQSQQFPQQTTQQQLHQQVKMIGQAQQNNCNRVRRIKRLNDFMKNIRFQDDESGDEPLSSISDDSDDSF